MLSENVIHIRESLLIGSRKTAFKLLILNISNYIVILMLVHLTLCFFILMQGNSWWEMQLFKIILCLTCLFLWSLFLRRVALKITVSANFPVVCKLACFFFFVKSLAISFQIYFL